MDSFLDECPICYNPYREPKGLPCLHTFCRECLQIHINNYTVDGLYFNCPICRNRTVPFGDQYTRICEWAKSFPTNNYILNRHMEISHKHCPTHQNEILDISCRTCRVMICYQCCLGHHETCEKTLTRFYGKRIKNNFIKSLEDLKVNLERLGKLDEDKKFTETRVKQMSKELTDWIRNEEQEIKAANSRESSTLQEQRENLVHNMKLAEENINDIDNLVGGDDTDDWSESLVTFDYQPRHTLMTQTTDILKEVYFRINPNFVKFKDEILKENLVEKLENPASAEITGATNESVNRHLIREFNLVCNIRKINVMVMLPDKSFLITDNFFKKLSKCSAGKILRDIYFPSAPYGLCLLRNNCVAVSQPYVRKITIFECTTLQKKDSFSFGKHYYGLGSDDNKRIFALYRDHSMCVDIISKASPQSSYNICHVIQLPTMFHSCDHYMIRVLPAGHVLIINSVNSLNVACIDQNGTIVFRYQGDSDNRLYSIADIAVGRDFIYVADKTKNRIYRIRHEGSFVDILLMSNDGISQPEKVFNNGDVLAVLSKTNQNYRIQLFSS